MTLQRMNPYQEILQPASSLRLIFLRHWRLQHFRRSIFTSQPVSLATWHACSQTSVQLKESTERIKWKPSSVAENVQLSGGPCAILSRWRVQCQQPMFKFAGKKELTGTKERKCWSVRYPCCLGYGGRVASERARHSSSCGGLTYYKISVTLLLYISLAFTLTNLDCDWLNFTSTMQQHVLVQLDLLLQVHI